MVRIGTDPEPFLGAAAADSEAGNDLVEDEERAGGRGQRAQGLEEPRSGGTTPMFPATGSTRMHARPSP
jgi:hypothetical protein